MGVVVKIYHSSFLLRVKLLQTIDLLFVQQRAYERFLSTNILLTFIDDFELNMLAIISYV
jgi:hypothetical protein